MRRGCTSTMSDLRDHRTAARQEPVPSALLLALYSDQAAHESRQSDPLSAHFLSEDKAAQTASSGAFTTLEELCLAREFKVSRALYLIH